MCKWAEDCIQRSLHALYESSALHHHLLTSKIENVCKSLNIEILWSTVKVKPHVLFLIWILPFSRSNNTQLLIKEKSNVHEIKLRNTISAIAVNLLIYTDVTLHLLATIIGNCHALMQFFDTPLLSIWSRQNV